MLKYFIALLLVFISLPATAQDYEEELKEAARLGHLLYEFDSSAWAATDALRKKKKAWKLYTETATPKGWVTTLTDAGKLRTAFVAELNGKLVSVFDVETKGRKAKKKITFPEGRRLTDDEKFQIRAKSAFSTKDIEPCEEFLPMNSAVIPSPNGQGHYLYVMSATKKPNLAVVGRHFRFRLSKDGRTISNKTSFTNGCLGLPTRAPNGGKSVGLISSHLKTPYPQEHHVFLSLAHDMPFFVMTSSSGQVWKVEGTSIAPVDLETLGK